MIAGFGCRVCRVRARGQVLKVDGVELKVEHARRAGDVDLVIAPAANLSVRNTVVTLTGARQLYAEAGS